MSLQQMLSPIAGALRTAVPAIDGPRRALGARIRSGGLVALGVVLFGGGIGMPTASQSALPGDEVAKGVFVVDAGGRAIRSLEVGSSLHVGARRLRPNTTYEFRLGSEGAATPSLENAVSFARAGTDAEGTVSPFILWYETGVVGCAQRRREPRVPWTFRTFEEAEKALQGRLLTIAVYPVAKDPTGRTPPLKLRLGEAESTFRIPVGERRSRSP